MKSVVFPTLLGLTLGLLLPHQALAHGHTVKYVFDPQYAANISGWFQVRYWDNHYSPSQSKDQGQNQISTQGYAKASLHWQLDFSHVSPQALLQADGNCTGDVTMYMWHIHVKWSSNHTSEAFQQCSLALTGNHYDPWHACGPNSEFAKTDVCAGKTGSYNCTPESYKESVFVCERGDLSGKLGAVMLDEHKQSSGWKTDPYYPSFAESTPQWNIILHAMCGKATPRVACALGQIVHGKEYDQDEQQPEWHVYDDNQGDDDNDDEDEMDDDQDAGDDYSPEDYHDEDQGHDDHYQDDTPGAETNSSGY